MPPRKVFVELTPKIKKLAPSWQDFVSKKQASDKSNKKRGLLRTFEMGQ